MRGAQIFVRRPLRRLHVRVARLACAMCAPDGEEYTAADPLQITKPVSLQRFGALSITIILVSSRVGVEENDTSNYSIEDNINKNHFYEEAISRHSCVWKVFSALPFSGRPWPALRFIILRAQGFPPFA